MATESKIDPVVEMVELIAKALVDNPDGVSVKSVDGDRVVIDTVAAQGETQIIKNAEAELEL